MSQQFNYGVIGDNSKNFSCFMTAGESSPEVVFSSSWNERVTALSCPCMCILLLIRIDFYNYCCMYNNNNQ